MTEKIRIGLPRTPCRWSTFTDEPTFDCLFTVCPPRPRLVSSALSDIYGATKNAGEFVATIFVDGLQANPSLFSLAGAPAMHLAPASSREPNIPSEPETGVLASFGVRYLIRSLTQFGGSPRRRANSTESMISVFSANSLSWASKLLVNCFSLLYLLHDLAQWCHFEAFSFGLGGRPRLLLPDLMVLFVLSFFLRLSHQSARTTSLIKYPGGQLATLSHRGSLIAFASAAPL